MLHLYFLVYEITGTRKGTEFSPQMVLVVLII